MALLVKLASIFFQKRLDNEVIDVTYLNYKDIRIWIILFPNYTWQLNISSKLTLSTTLISNILIDVSENYNLQVTLLSSLFVEQIRSNLTSSTKEFQWQDLPFNVY